VLEGLHVRLEPLRQEHRDDLLASAAEDPGIFRYLPVLVEPSTWDDWLNEATVGTTEGRCLVWASIHRGTGRAVGSSRFQDISTLDGRLEIGWTWIAPSHQRTALNTEAKLLQLDYAFEGLGATRVALKTDARNLQSQAAIERLGAVREGTLRKQMRVSDGFIRDSVYYSILREEWPAVQNQLDARTRKVRPDAEANRYGVDAIERGR
jgi:RimJ/RimL family protein N-acetyltransferase